MEPSSGWHRGDGSVLPRVVGKGDAPSGGKALSLVGAWPWLDELLAQVWAVKDVRISTHS
eukprot:755788-Prymnesium_polylepis.1